MNSHFVTILKENYRYFGGISFLYGLFFAFCLYGNLSGITFPLCVIGTLFVYRLFMKKIGMSLKKGSKRYIIGMILLGFANCYTSNGMFQFFDIVGILLLFLVFMIHQFYEDRKWKCFLYVQNMFLSVGAFLSQILSPFMDGVREMKKGKVPDEKKKRMVKEILIGITITVPVLFIVMPLLVSSDMIFSGLLEGIFRLPDFKIWNFGSMLSKFVWFLVGVICCYGFFKGMCLLNLKTENMEIKKGAPLIGITLSSVMTIVYVCYSLIQILYLFIGFGEGLPKGVTYAEYARSGFFELLFVACINFFLVLVCNAIFEVNKLLKILLFIISGCTFIMIGSSGYRMILYIGQYHLTMLRVLVLWFLLVLIALMSGLIISIQREEFPLFRYIVAVVMCFYIPLVYSRPETIIARYNISQANLTYEDIDYLLYMGSYDCIPEMASIKLKNLNMENMEEANAESIELQIADRMYSVLNDGYMTQTEAEDLKIREWNYSEYQAKKAARKYLDTRNKGVFQNE